MPTQPLTSWSVGNLRLTAFPTEPERRNNLNWWTEVVGTDPEIVTTRKAPARHEEAGKLEAGGRLILRIEPVRIDWLLRPSEPGPGALPDIVGTMPDALTFFIGLIKRWIALQGRPEIKRLALGMLLHQPVDNAPNGYRRLAEYIPAATIDPETTRDFSYRINRPRRSTSVTTLMINRLNTWTVGAIESVTIETTGDRHAERGYVVSVEMDINTPAEHQGSLPGDALPSVIDELAALSVEIAGNGDQP
jgi:hypothetical protein